LDRLPEAAEAYSHSLKLDPLYAWAWNGQGLVHIAQGRWDLALACFEKATQNNPQDVWFWYNQGESLFHLRRYSEALGAYERVLLLDATNEAAKQRLQDTKSLLVDPPAE
jgi:tetratricopeptide (TPR) repeat protein